MSRGGVKNSFHLLTDRIFFWFYTSKVKKEQPESGLAVESGLAACLPSQPIRIEGMFVASWQPIRFNCHENSHEKCHELLMQTDVLSYYSRPQGGYMRFVYIKLAGGISGCWCYASQKQVTSWYFASTNKQTTVSWTKQCYQCMKSNQTVNQWLSWIWKIFQMQTYFAWWGLRWIWNNII